MPKISEVEAVVAVITDFRAQRLRYMKENPASITDEDELPVSLSREAEALRIIHALRQQ
jgi:hypothetical protein